MTWVILLVITVAMLVAERFHMPRAFLVVFLLAFMMVKAVMIGGNFMHLRFERRNLAFMVSGGILVTSLILYLFITPEARHVLSPLGALTWRGAGSPAAPSWSCWPWPPADLQAQCAMCQTALTNSAEGRGIIAEFNRAILLMIVAPYAVFAAVGVAAFRGRIREAWKRRTTARRPPLARWGRPSHGVPGNRATLASPPRPGLAPRGLDRPAAWRRPGSWWP